MNQDRLQQLIEAHLDGHLSAAEARELSDHLAHSPDACRTFWELAQQHALLLELVAEGAGRRLAESETRRPAPRVGPLRAVVGTLLALAASLLLVLSAWWLLSPPTSGPAAPDEGGLATLSELHGDVRLVVGTALEKALPGMNVLAGMEVRTGQDGAAIVSYPDSSRFQLGPNSAVRVLGPDEATPADQRKRVYLVKGAVEANVAPQPQGRPMVVRTEQGDLLTGGTRFSWATLLDEARLELQEGLLTFNAPSKSGGLPMGPGAFALVSTPVPEMYQSAPLLPASNVPAEVIEEPSGPVTGLAVSRDGNTLAVAAFNGELRLWDMQQRRFGRSVPLGVRPHGLAFSPDGQWLATGGDNRHKGLSGVLVFDAQQGTLKHQLPRRKPQALAWLPDSRALVFSANEKGRCAYLWDIEDGRERLYLGDSERAGALAVSPDGRTVALGCRDGQVELYDLSSGRPSGTLRGHTRDVQTVAYQPGGALLATGSRDGTVRLWDALSGELQRTLTGKFGEVRCLTFSPDGRTLASGHGGVVMLWDVATGEKQTTLLAHRFAVTAVAYLPDARTLATAGWDRSVKLWKLFPRPID